ncbi:cysteine desulfurase, SufS subfamily [Desulfurococcus amylolyticus 1221n]|uniref:Cysteine desulfurase n=2 Tax=Desulfurococcus amylolyticus TaxID=94694 RepID=B8D324_DESA1|nr:cysteine desulfurase, SufS subfamily [Desulfurococcus amylolyticus 1221n]
MSWMFDPEEIRKDFPILNREVNGKKLVYFDNAATTQKPIQVINAIRDFYMYHNANVHRGFHTLSQEASQMYEEAHEKIAKFINAYSWREIIFCSNTTEALNIVAYGWGLWNLREGDEIILTVMDHHSSMLPWRLIAKLKNAKVKYIDITNDGYLKYELLEEFITEKTRVVAFPIASNVLGTINDSRRIARLAHSVGAIVVADGAQSVPHLPTNIKELEIDFLAFSGHKMLGPTGIGVLWGRQELLESMHPFKVGGDTIKDVTLDNVVWHDLPWRFEAGTPNIAGGIGLGAAVDYLLKIGMENVREHEKALVEYTLKRLGEIEDVEYYGPRNPRDKTGVIAFNIKGLNHHTVGSALDLFGIAVRTGMHCAHPLHYRLGLKGTVRASYYIYNTLEEVDYFIETLEKIVSLKESLKSKPPTEVCTGT